MKETKSESEPEPAERQSGHAQLVSESECGHETAAASSNPHSCWGWCQSHDHLTETSE